MTDRSSPTGGDGDASGDGTGSIRHVAPSAVPSLLERLEAICGRWVDDRADLFDPYGAETLGEHHVRRKAFNELSVYLLLCDHLPVEPVVDAADCRDVVLAGANCRPHRHALQRNPVYVRWYGYPLAFAELAGELRERTTGDALRRILRSDHVWAKDRTPSGAMDLWHLATLCDVDPPYGPDEILRTSCLARELHPVRAELADVYSLTHNVMFYRGFGMGGLGFPSGPAPYDVGRSHRALLLRFLAEAKYDAVCELLLTGILQRQVPPDLVGVCLDRLVSAAETTGYLPDYSVAHDDGGVINRRNAELLGHRDDRAVHWGTQYHANVVAGYVALSARAEWPAVREAYRDRQRPEYDPGTLLALGEALARLADYDLRAGARALETVAGTDAAEAYPAAFETAVSFLREQRRSDGAFGYWTDERIGFERRGFDPAAFEDSMVAPVTEACEAALDAIERASDG